MPAEQFEAMIADRDNVAEGYKRKHPDDAGQLRFKDMIRKGMVSDALLDNILRAAAIYKEESSGKITLLQMNEQYAHLTGLTSSQGERFDVCMNADELQKFRILLEEAKNHLVGGSQGKIRFVLPDGNAVSVEMRVFLLYTLEGHRLYLSTIY